jgi:hypothetical protein
MNQYSFFDGQAFDVNSLHPGEIGVEVTSLAERQVKEDLIYELGLRIFYVANEENAEYIDREFKHVLFLGKNRHREGGMLRDFFTRSKFQTNTWKSDSDNPPSVMMPGAIKMLVLRHLPIMGAVKPGTQPGAAPRNFFNLLKIIRVDPSNSEEYPDALPDPIPNEMVVEAFNTPLEGQDVSSKM